jgi:hypothetical protein
LSPVPRVVTRFLGLAIGAVLLAAACRPLPPPPPPEPVGQYCAGSVPNSPAAYQAAFDGLRSTYTEWASADESVPINLPDGRVVWVFADTSVGHVLSGGVLDPANTLAHNSFVVQTGACFAPLLGGVPHARSSLIPDPGPNQWYWPTSGVVDPASNTLRVFILHELRTGGAALDFVLLDVQVATFSLPGLALQSIQPLPFPTAAQGYGETSFLNPADGKVYLYGAVSGNSYAARAPVGQLTGPAASWEFAVGGPQAPTWSTDPAAATPQQWINVPPINPIFRQSGDGPVAKPSVIPYGSGYLATAKLIDAFSDDVSVFTAATPAGPWTYVGVVANTQLAGTIAYGAFTRLTLPGLSDPVIIYNTNVSPFVANPPPGTISNYGPHFVSPGPSFPLPPP